MREEFDRRPMMAVFLGLAVGSAAGVVAWFALYGLPLLFLAKRWTVRVALLVSAIAGFLLYPRLDATPVVEESFYEGTVDVLSMPVSTGDRSRSIAQVGDKRYVLYLDQSSSVVFGDRVKVRAEIAPLREGQVGQRGAVGSMGAISEPTVVDGGFALWRVGLWVRNSFRAFTDQFANAKTGPLLDAMCFSMTADLSHDFRTAMARTGTTHIVSTSGLHVVLAAYALAFLIGAFPLPRWAQIGLLVLVLGVYAAAAGMQPPIVRSILMMLVFLVAYMVRRGSDGLSCLAFAGALSLLWAPELVSDIGFQLSMVAVGSLVLFARAPDEGSFSVREFALRYAEASLVVTLATAPLLAYHFGSVPLMSIPANLLIVPVLGIVISGALIAWAVWLVLPAVGVGLLKVVIEPTTGWVGAVIERLGSLPFAAIYVPEFSAYWLLPVYVLCLLIWRPHVREA